MDAHFKEPRKFGDSVLSNVSSVLVPSNEPLIKVDSKVKMKKKKSV